MVMGSYYFQAYLARHPVSAAGPGTLGFIGDAQKIVEYRFIVLILLQSRIVYYTLNPDSVGENGNS